MRRPRPAGHIRRTAAGAAILAALAAVPAQAQRPQGTVRVCAAALGGLPPAVVKAFHREHRALRIKDVPPASDNAHDELVALQRRGSRRCDLYVLDVPWTAEFALPGWAADVTSIVRPRAGRFFPSALSTARYRGRYHGVPIASDAGLLYYRTDRVAAPPDTWQGVYASAQANGGIVYQGSAYEGLTCDFLELAYAAGGSVLSEDGRTATIDSAENLAALRLMVEGLRTEAAPSVVAMYFDEQAAFTAFFAGGPAYMRNWAYAYDFGKQTSIGDQFDVAPLPAFAGGGRAGVLGGANLALSRSARNRRGAVVALRYLTSPAAARVFATRWQTPPALIASYDDPAVQEVFPFAAQLRQAIQDARTRPVHPRYPVISAAIYENVNAALLGDVTPEVALRRAGRRIDRVLRG